MAVKLPPKDAKNSKRLWHDDDHLTSLGAAKALGVSPSKIQQLRRDKDAPKPAAAKYGDRMVYKYTADSIEALETHIAKTGAIKA